MKINCGCERAMGAALLRWTLGIMFFIAGINKFMGEGGPAAVSKMLASGFENTWLPSFAVVPFAYATPYAEVLLGALLVLGLGRCIVAPLSGLFMLGLTFGVLILSATNHEMQSTVFQNTLYTALFALMIATAEWDRLTLDNLLFGRKSNPVGFSNP